MRLRELGQVSREARDLRVDLIYVYKYLLEGGKKTEPASSWWFPVTGQGAISTNGNNFLKYLFTYFKVKHWKRVPRMVMWSHHYGLIL